jgi:hypothetical protein
MRQKTIEVESGRAKDDGSWATYFAATFANDKAAQRRINRTTWSNNKRKYYRKKTVWECKSNCGNHNAYTSSQKITKVERIESKADAVERLAASKARIEELKLEAQYNYTFFDWFIHYSWSLLKIVFGLFMIFVGIVIIFG